MGRRVLVGIEADLEFGVETRLTFDDDPPDTVDSTRTALRPVRRSVTAHAVDVFDGDHLLAVDHADAPEPDRPHSPLVDDTGAGLESTRSGSELTGLTDLVQLHAEPLRHHRDRGAPTECDDSGHFDATLVPEWLAEAEELTHLVVQRVAGVVGDLDPPDRVHAARHGGQRHGEEVASESGFDARGVDRAVATLAGLVDAGHRGRPHRSASARG